MSIKEFRGLTNMSQKEFSEQFDIPIGTIRNWEQNISNPPEYVYKMIINNLRRDKMINVETIKFVNMLNKLASLSSNGIEKFSKATSETYGVKLFYDDISLNENNLNRVVLDAVLDAEHHDIVCYYDSDSNEYTIQVEVDESSKEYIVVKLTESKEEIIVEDGSWYFAT